MNSLTPSDLAFAEIAVQRGAVSFKELDQIIQDVNNGLVLRREDESLGPYLARTGQITMQQLYEIALEVSPTLAELEDAKEKKQKVEHPFGLILTNLTDADKKAKAALLVAELRHISLEQATGLCSSSVVPAMTRLSREDADAAKARFHKLGVECRVIKWKRQSKENHDVRPGSKKFRVHSGRQNVVSDSHPAHPEKTELERSASSRLRPVFVTPENAPNPFTEPVETFDQDPLENTNSISEDSVDFLVVGSNESDVIFLEAPADDNTATAVTVFSESALDPGHDSLLAKPKAQAKPSPPKESKLGIDSVVGGFRLTKILGKGGFAKVYLGEHTVLGHKAAVKVYKTRDSKLLRRITRREATLISRLRHPRLVSILNVGQEAGSFFIIMEYVPGLALGQYVKNHGPLSPKRAATVIRDIAEALNFIHRNGLVHRDVKPSNFLLEDNGRARLLDFELIKSFSDQLNENLPEDVITQSGQLIGTPRFMSPEQIDDVHTIGPTSDVYSLGAAFYFLITGRHPYNGKSLIQIIKEVLIKEAPPPSEFCEGLPESLEKFIQRMMDKDPTKRPQSMSEVIETLEQLDLAAQAHVQKPDSPPTRRMRMPRASTRITGVYRLPTDTVFVDEGSHVTKPMFPSDETETDANYKAIRYREDLGSTVVSNELNVGKVDNNTIISPPTLLEDELDSVLIAKKWEELKNHDQAAKELLLSEVPETIHNTVPLAAARQWKIELDVEVDFNAALNAHRKRADVKALRLLNKVLKSMPEHREAHELYAKLSEHLFPNLDVVVKLSKEGKSQLFKALTEFVEDHAKADQIKAYIESRTDSKEEVTLGEFLEKNTAAIWQHDILDRLFERGQLRQIARGMGLKVSRRASKRRIIADVLQTMGFHADKILH